jgi:hypothetical protein
MSPIKAWGPTTWDLIHCATINIKNDSISKLGPELFAFIIRICHNLPCPTCADHAKVYMRKLMNNNSFITDKNKLTNAMYIFHNDVNKMINKSLYKYENLEETYKKKNIVIVFNNFARDFNTVNNLNMLTENFHRQRLLKEFKIWLLKNINSFNIPR